MEITDEMVAAFAKAWRETPQGRPGDRTRAGLAAVVDGVDEDTIFDLIPSFDVSHHVPDWPQDEQDAYHAAPSLHAGINAVDDLRRRKVARDIIAVLSREGR
jgi:hypothetical protein